MRPITYHPSYRIPNFRVIARQLAYSADSLFAAKHHLNRTRGTVQGARYVCQGPSRYVVPRVNPAILRDTPVLAHDSHVRKTEGFCIPMSILSCPARWPDPWLRCIQFFFFFSLQKGPQHGAGEYVKSAHSAPCALSSSNRHQHHTSRPRKAWLSRRWPPGRWPSRTATSPHRLRKEL